MGVTAQTLAVTVDYSYNPNASQYIGGVIKNVVIPQLVIRVTSTDATTSKVKVTYLANAGFDGELVQAFADVARAGNLRV